MGVQNLWVLLAPVGRQIEIESLAGQVLAVDASIWLTQFVKAMRDDEGNMIRNAHLLGTLHRVAKLLFYGVRPVFVFDGQTPEIKKRTTARRRKRQEQQSANLRHTAQRILLNRLKQHRQEVELVEQGAPAPAVAPGFTLPEVAGKKDEEAKEEEETKEVDDGVEVVEQGSTESVEEEKKEEDAAQTVWDAAAEQEEEGEDLTLEDIDLDTSRLSKIDLHVVFSLPPHLQKDMIQKILRDRRQEVRDQFIPLAGNPEKYSHTQISAFLQTSALNRRIEAAKRQKREEEMENHGGAGMGSGHRIDSNSNRFYIYQNDAEHKEEKDQEEEDVVAEVERSATAERLSITESVKAKTKDQMRGNAFKEMEKRPLSEFSSGKESSAPDASATEVTAAWVARHHVRAKQEPVLAIEKLRQARLKKDTPPSSVAVASSTSVQQVPVGDVSVSLKLEDVDKEEIERFQKLFPATKVERLRDVAEPASAAVVALPNTDEDDEDDDIDWEEVSAPAQNIRLSRPVQIKQNTLGNSAPIAATVSTDKDLFVEKQSTNKKAESEDEMEWEDGGVDASSTDSRTNAHQTADEEKEGLSSSDFQSPDDQKPAENLDEESTDELFLTLRNEMEDAKAHEDLAMLKDEALQSAMATASNLTQWAAGAVRRALQAHSLQHGGKIGTHGSPGRTLIGTQGSPGGMLGEQMEARASPSKGIAEDPIDVSDENEDSTPALSHTKHAEVVVIEDEEEEKQDEGAAYNDEDSSHEQLQATLAASIASEQEESKESTTRVCYLQYSQPAQSPKPQLPSEMNTDVTPEMNADALQKEQLELKKLRSRQLRDTEGITDDMVAEVMALLRLFGVPFLVSPMEAEAQCAALEQLGLVDGVITDDSDIFPFGGQRVYKNIFHHQKFVEAFSARDIQRELGFSREQIIALALLLGSDYTDGVRGIGIVNATEIAAAYPGIEGLREFKGWVQSFDVAEEAQRLDSAGSKKKKKKANKEKENESEEDSEESDDETTRERFQRSHASVRRKWELGDEFPSKQVVQAYMAPQVDRSEARFSWSAPDLAALRNYCANAFGWDQLKSDGVLQPLEEKAKAAAASGGRHVQTRLDRFFTSYDDQVHYAQIKSKRLRSAVNQRPGNKGSKSKKQRK
ncbi:unnamed protein product [Phytophthora lilii]|uniref:Unnamed protein product n=1 Tax=Phytophthora lilii TaxID=2077276 RepID=A0A9W6X8J2_9STRA|nr:unnamed protein product [Phytophthora lilii]